MLGSGSAAAAYDGHAFLTEDFGVFGKFFGRNVIVSVRVRQTRVSLNDNGFVA